VAALISSGHRSADDGDGRRKRRDGGIGERTVDALVSPGPGASVCELYALPPINKSLIDPSLSVLLRATALGLNDLRFNYVSPAPRRVAFSRTVLPSIRTRASEQAQPGALQKIPRTSDD
jgi:hypothetical protein